MTRTVVLLLLLVLSPVARPCAALFAAGLSEHDMVAVALDAVKARGSATAAEKAALWEELADDIARRVGHPVSLAIATNDGSFIFQGVKPVNGGKRYFLVIASDGNAYTTTGEPVRRIPIGTVDLDTLNPL